MKLKGISIPALALLCFKIRAINAASIRSKANVLYHGKYKDPKILAGNEFLSASQDRVLYSTTVLSKLALKMVWMDGSMEETMQIECNNSQLQEFIQCDLAIIREQSPP